MNKDQTVNDSSIPLKAIKINKNIKGITTTTTTTTTEGVV